MMLRPLILLGAGGHCKSVIEVAESIGYEIKGVLGLPSEVGKTILSTKVIGTDADIKQYIDKAFFVVTVGHIKSPAIRIKLFNTVKEFGGFLPTLVASSAHVSKYASLGEGTIVMHQACVNAGANVGKNVILNTFSNIEHDVKIGDHCHISTGAMINGDCTLGNNIFVGSQAVISNNITICDNTIIGSGANVIQSILTEGLYYGNPAALKK